ncbi:AAA family ATPase [Aeromonas dhakensis]|uniref:AAA family ATPase n=1 Tax=Aeromonas dhakensis TaxID=196024 RepID=UPI001FCADA76|nr:AAA family ATPase [Aeromonas dhakensis]MCJ2367607.1 AAA family ATPase [Aeromonas dhakensis]
MSEHTDKDYSLGSLYLDPNNYRFIDKDEYIPVSDVDITDPRIQKRTAILVAGKRNEEIKDLLDSLKQNGYLPVDQIQIKKISDKKYLVVEGNRRITALKRLQEIHDEGGDIGSLNPDVFKKVPVVLYTGDNPSKHKILMGLKHISGNKKWAAINQAKLIESLLTEDGLTEEFICKSIGISKQELRATQRTLNLISLYKNSDYGDQFKSEKYSIFREIIKSTKIKSWLNIENDDLDFSQINKSNLNRLFSWISESERDIEDEDIDDQENYITYNELPIINTALEIRELAKIINDESAISNLESTRSLTEATLSSEVLGKNKLANAITLIREQANVAFNLSSMIDDSNISTISDSVSRLQALLVNRTYGNSDNQDLILRRPLFNALGSHFQSIHLGKFKQFDSIDIPELSKINIFAGINNSGKTTLLEGLYLLSRMGDIKDLVNIYKYRRKSLDIASTQAQFDAMPSQFLISANFNGRDIALDGQKQFDSDLKNQHGFIGSVQSCCIIDSDTTNHSADFLVKNIIYKSNRNDILCNSLISMSSSTDDVDVFRECYVKSVKNGAKRKIVDFIRANIDDKIIDIELIHDGNTFYVSHIDDERSSELSQYGDGLQKIFYLAIKIAACENGVIFLDEVENGIHKSLFWEFARLIHSFTTEYNVQLFVTSHSKECIDAFLSLKEYVDDISSYSLGKDDNGITLKRYSGKQLEKLIEYMNLDIRG